MRLFRLRNDLQVSGASAAEVWAALRDVGEVHRRVAPGFVKDCRMDGEARVVTFGHGLWYGSPTCCRTRRRPRRAR